MVIFNTTLKVGHRHMIISCFHRHNVYGQNKSAVGPTIDSAASMERERERYYFLSPYGAPAASLRCLMTMLSSMLNFKSKRWILALDSNFHIRKKKKKTLVPCIMHEVSDPILM